MTRRNGPATEHVAGGTLADRLRSGPLEGGELQELAQDLLGTLFTLHQAGVLYRDLTPANVLLGADGRMRLPDPGTAQLTGVGRLAPAGEPIGTQTHLAPEVRAGGSADVRSDLYAGGVLLDECAGPDASGLMLVMIGMLTAAEPDLRPASAAEALALLGVEPAAAPVAPAPRPPVVEQATAPMVVPWVAEPEPEPELVPVPESAAVIESAESAESAELPLAPDFPPAVDFPAALDIGPAAPAAPSDFPPAAVLPPAEVDPSWLDRPAPGAYPAAPAADVPAYVPADVPRRRRPARRFVVAALVVPVVLAIAAFGVVTSRDDGDSGPPIPPPVDGTLTQQLDGLDRAIDLARK